MTTRDAWEVSMTSAFRPPRLREDNPENWFKLADLCAQIAQLLEDGAIVVLPSGVRVATLFDPPPAAGQAQEGGGGPEG